MIARGGVFCALSIACALCAGPASAATLTVDDNKAQCPAAGYTSVTAALSAAGPNDTVNVCAGIYKGQFVIPAAKPGVKLVSTPRRAATLRPPAVIAGKLRAIVVAAGQGSKVSGFRILGPLPNQPTPCGSLGFSHETGVQVGANDVRVVDNQIRDIRDNCGQASGVWAGDAQDELSMGFTAGNAVIKKNLIEIYQRYGVIAEANAPTQRIKVASNTILGSASRPTTGVLGGQESSVKVTDNLIRLNRTAGIALTGFASALHVVRRNHVTGGVGIGIRMGGDGVSKITDNLIDFNYGDGILDVFSDGGGNKFARNRINANGGAGINLQGQAARVKQNRITNNRAYGIRNGGSGTVFSGNILSGNRPANCLGCP